VLVGVELTVDVTVDVAVLNSGRDVAVEVAEVVAVELFDDVAVVEVLTVDVTVLDADVVAVV
jgi:hypothetical protein